MNALQSAAVYCAYQANAIAQLREQVEVQAVTIRWLKQMVSQLDRELARAEAAVSDSFFSQLD